MKKRLLALLMALVLLMPVVGIAWDGIAYVHAPTSDRVHLRETPSMQGKSLGLYFTGTQITVRGSMSDEWVKVRVGEVNGYMNRECISTQMPASAAPAYVVQNPNSSWVNLRQAPSTSSQSLGRYNNGTGLRLLGETADGWSYVSVGSQTGYMVTTMVAAAGSVRPAATPVPTFAPVNTLTPIRTASPTVTHGPYEQQQPGSLSRVGETRNEGVIYCYTAPNGQLIYFDGDEQTPEITQEDVNFDGRSDLVITTTFGASNYFCELFVFDGSQYVRVAHPFMEYGFCNYQLYPQQRMVGSHANNGYAGALHEDILLRWEGTQLKMVRRAIADTAVVDEYFGDRFVSTTYAERVTVTIRDYTTNQYDGNVIFEETLDLNAMDSNFFTREETALWQGLR